MNIDLYEKAVSNSGLKKKAIAQEMGFSTITLRNKVTEKTDITGKEIMKLCKILNISSAQQKVDIFLS